MRQLRDAACEYATRGWAILPLQASSKRPLANLVPKGKDDASSDLIRVLRWWERAPKANIGIHCSASGLIALDVDPRNGGDDSLHDLETRWGKLPDTPRALSGGGGVHILFSHPSEGITGVLAPGIDIKDSGYVVAPPSIHPSGKAYEWELDPSEHEIVNIPARWLEGMRIPSRKRQERQSRTNTGESLRAVLADDYIAILTGRLPNHEGFVQCPFHKGGEERTPSLATNGILWACYGSCHPPPGKLVMGGNIYDFAGLLWGYGLPLRGTDFLEVRARLEGLCCQS